MLKYLPLVVVAGLTIYCFIDVLTTDRRRFQSLGKPMWLLVVLLPVVGAILWLFVGRPRHKATSAGDSVIHLRRAPRPLAPDDDPEFLKELDRRAWRARRETSPEAQDPSAEGEAASPSDAAPTADADPDEAAPEDPEATEPPAR